MSNTAHVVSVHNDEIQEEGNQPPLIPKGSFKSDDVQPEVMIPLERLLLDAYEFHGLKELGFYFWFFAFFVVFVWFQWSNRGAEFRSSIVDSLRAYDTGNNWEISDLKQVESMKDAVQHITGYLDHYITYTLDSDEPVDEGVVVIGDYAEVQLAVVSVVMPPPHCMIKDRWTSRCPNQTAVYAARCNATAREQMYEATTNNLTLSGRWQKNPTINHTWDTVIVSRMKDDALKYGLDVNTSSYFKRVRDIIESDSAIISTYTNCIMLRMLMTSELGPDVVLVELKLKLNQRILNKGLKPTLLMLTVSVEQKWWLIGVGIVTMVLCLHLLRKELRTWWLCKYQGDNPLLYFKFVWNWISLITLLSTQLFLGFYLVYSFAQRETESCNNWLNTKVDDILSLRARARLYTLYLYFGIAIIGCQGFGMVRYMRVHAGLKAFYQVFVLSFDICKDFFVFVLYMFLVLGLLVFGMFQISGGNKLFVDYGTGLAAMARLQFQLLDFEEFTNLGLGFGRWSAFINFLFWASIVLLVVFVANILLAIFQFAYEKVKQRAVAVEYSFPYLVFLRVLFMIQQILCVFKYAWKTLCGDDSNELVQWSGAHNYREWLSENWLLELMKERDEKGLKENSWTQLWARWLIARKQPMYALTTLYTSYKDLRLIGPTESPVWEKDSTAGLKHSRVRSRRSMRTNSRILDRGQGPVQLPPLPEGSASAPQLPCRTDKITRSQLMDLMKSLEKFSDDVQPKNWVFRFLMAWHVRSTTLDTKGKLVNYIISVYQDTEAPSRGVDDDDILNEESKDPTEVVLEKIQDLFEKLDRVSQGVDGLERKMEQVEARLGRDRR